MAQTLFKTHVITGPRIIEQKETVNILVINDNKGELSLFCFALCAAQYSVNTATAIKEGINKAQINKPDIVFVDSGQLQTAGPEILLELRKICPCVPLYILSEFNAQSIQLLKSVRCCGCNFEICRKPLDSDNINFIVKGFFEKRISSSYEI